MIKTTVDLVRFLYARFRTEINSRLALIREYNVTSRAKHNLDGGSTGNPDCVFMYLSVRGFSRHSIFEIGTYVGTSAVAMAEAVRFNNGQVTTCDPESYNCIPDAYADVICFLYAPSAIALASLKKEDGQVDFVFADWIPDDESIHHINEPATDDLIFTAHDYVLPNDKDVVAVEKIMKGYRRAGECAVFLPEQALIEVEPNLFIEQTTAAIIPVHLLDAICA